MVGVRQREGLSRIGGAGVASRLRTAEPWNP
jgi:hypothetical protein